MSTLESSGPSPLWEELGLPKPEYEEEINAPPITPHDLEALRDLFHNRLSASAAQLYRSYVQRFRSWAKGFMSIVREEASQETRS